MKSEAPLFVHPRNDYTGSTRVLANIIESDYSSSDVWVITLNDGKGFLSDLCNIRIISCWLPTFNGRPIKIISESIYSFQVFFIILYLGRKFPSVYINTITPYAAAISARIIRKKLIYHIHEVFQSRNWLNLIRVFVFNHIRSHRIFVSKYAMLSYRNKLSCTSEIKYNKLPQSFIDNVKLTMFATRKLNNILMISSLSIEKGVYNFIRVASILPEYYFTLILSSDNKTIKNSLNVFIPSNLKILPSQSNIHPHLENTDLIVNMTIPYLCIETFGMTILEAMPYGIPAIVPNIGGPVELVIDNYNGYTVDTSNIEKVANSIKNALNNRNYQRLSANTLKLFKSKFE